MADIQQILEKYWGYKAFRPLQREIISSVLAGRDTVALLPTGGGKSLTYQVPALALPGVTIVVTPLIALMKDQVDALRRRHINAVAIHSALSAREIDVALDNCVYGDVKLLYIAPERIDTRIFHARVRKMEVSLVAVDEAHCISEWGYDFRPAYLKIARLREWLPRTPFLAVTATATSLVLADIREHLKLDDPQVFRGSFARPNISFVVRHGENKLEQMLRVIRGVAGSGIVYARTRKATEEIAEQLRAEGVAADFYHAGLGFRMRASKQEAWLRGEVRVIVATNAFGMGIDKADVRFVVHDQMPASLEAYYQEAGRAGRDGLPSYAVLLYNGMDARAARQRIETSYPPLDTVRKVYEAIFNHLQVTVGGGKEAIFDFDIREFSARFKMFPLTVFNAIKLLELNGYMTLTDVLDNPTRIMFRLSREELYKLQVDRTELDGFLRVVLRLYTGLFTEFVAVDEAYIARMSGYTEKRVKELLYQLSVMRVIRYIPRRSSPLLILQEERLPAEDVAIAPATYHRRREMEELRAAAMAEYAENGSQCRSVLLREYFDERDPEPCGVCDVCLSRRREELFRESDAFAGLRTELLRVLAEVPAGRSITLHALVAAVPGRPMMVLTVLRRLLAEGRVRQSDDGGLALNR
ncbi:RecQ family ATP-dependent DNA helicase [Rikenella microfusus]|uniref:ATP-dependent DNA helicase RecQ n=1 Tax=Rikenella microfusus TaxID=28139 RepID=A0A379MSR5_9BACT|nr:ATP-dependent DNA helicase RecQ [Rikenella microfusus]SUE34678.1 ATP-dependent DNA helicase recQ [Rikenella microfusus]HJE87488.1 RecQ family ATP-dependent DNA helicase [Rikenella microfusus]